MSDHDDLPRQADVVFVGAGHNALIAAACVAGAGRSVCLLARMPQPGGWVQTAELGAQGLVTIATRRCIRRSSAGRPGPTGLRI